MVASLIPRKELPMGPEDIEDWDLKFEEIENEEEELVSDSDELIKLPSLKAKTEVGS